MIYVLYTPSMVQLPRLQLCLFYSLAVYLAGVHARVVSVEPVAEPPPLTQAPKLELGNLYKRDSPICGYFSGIAQSSLTCNAPNDCYIFTAAFGFYSAKAACGIAAASSYFGPWGLCVDYNGGLCPNVASCSSVYTSVLFCPSNYPYCVRYEMRDTANDPYYYVLLDCTVVYHSTPIQILFTPTTTEATLLLSTPTPVHSTPTAASQTPITPTPTPTSSPPTSTPPSTFSSPSPSATPSPTPSSTPPTTTTSTSTPTTSPSTTATLEPTPISTPTPTTDSSSSSSTSSGGLTVGDQAGIAGAVVGAIAIFTGLIGIAFPHETRVCLSYFLCCFCAARRSSSSVPTYSTGPIPLRHI